MQAKRLMPITVIIVLLLLMIAPAAVYAGPFIDYTVPADDYGYAYRLSIAVEGDKSDGTDGDIDARFVFHDGTVRMFRLDDPKNNDFVRNTFSMYRIRIDKPGYMLKTVELINQSGDGLCIKSIAVTLGELTEKVFEFSHRWISKSGGNPDRITLDVTDLSRRKVKGSGDFNSVFNDVLYLEEGAQSGIKDFNWNAIISDQIYLNPYLYYEKRGGDVPVFSIALSGMGSGKARYTAPDAFITTNSVKYDGIDYGRGFTVDKSKIYSEMAKKGVNKLTVTPTLTYASRSTNSFNGGYKFSGAVDIIRKNFAIGELAVVNDSEAFKAYKDNNFYNASAGQIKLRLEIMSGDNHDNYNAADIAKNISGIFRLRYNANKDYVEPTEIKNEGRYVYLTFPVPQGKDNDGSGLTLEMKGVTSKSGNMAGFKLVDGDKPYSETVERYISTHKIDTKAPDLTLSGNITGIWKNTHEFSVNSSENLYINNASPREEKNAGYFCYTLYDSDSYAQNGEKALSINIKNFDNNKGSTGSHIAPRSAGTKIPLKLMNKEEGRYTLVLSGYDFAGNKAQKAYPGVWLDNKAPDVSFNATERPKNNIDKSRSTEFRFTIKDLSERGVLYYCFVEDGEAVPKVEGETKTSGNIVSLIGKWAYIEQSDAPTSTVVLKLKDGDIFKGRLYYFATDSSGNNTAADNIEIKQSGVDYKTGYNYADIDMNNESIECTLIAGSYSYPASDYNISFDYNPNYTIKYRWVGYTPSHLYTNQNVGSGSQLNGSGKEILLNGECTLEYTVTDKSGNYRVYTRSFVFDNKPPEAGITVKNSGSVRNSHSFILNANDISGIKNASYIIADASNTDVAIAAGRAEINNGIVNTDLSLENVKSGAYKLIFTAEDNNGIKTEVQSSTVYIRSGAPKAEAKPDLNDTAGDFYLTSKNDYRIMLKVMELMNGAGLFAENQHVKYRISEDGIKYGDWMTGEKLKPGDGGLSAEFGISNPIGLEEGLNTIYIQVANAAFADNLADIMPDRITTIEPIKILYDIKGPEYLLMMEDSMPTRLNISGTVILQDTASGNEGMTLRSDDGNIVVSEPQLDEGTGLYNRYNITVTDSVDSKITARDKAGNETIIPIKVTCIDRRGPIADGGIMDREEDDLGNPAPTGFINVEGAIAEKTRFAFINEVSFNGEIREEDFIYNSHDFSVVMALSTETGFGETASSYFYYLKGVTGSYKIGVYAVDHLGNETLEIVCQGVKAKYQGEAQIIDYKIASNLVGKNAAVTINFNMPVYILPKDLQTSQAKEDMTLDETNEELALNNAGRHTKTHIYTASKNGTFKIYAADNYGRTYTFEITVDGVEFGQGVPLTQRLYRDTEELDMEEIHGEYRTEPVYLHITFDSDTYDDFVLNPLDDENENTDFAFEPNLSEEFSDDKRSGGYKELVYYSNCTPNFYKNVQLTVSEAVYGAGFIGSSYQAGKLTVSEAVYGSYPANDFYQNGQSIYETLVINCLDSTAPKVDYSVSTPYMTANNVFVSLMPSDPETGIKSLKYYLRKGLEEIEYIPIADNALIEVPENGTLYVLAENGSGMETEIQIPIQNIQKEPIVSGEDYTVSYYYQDHEGNWQEMKDGKYYRTAKAVINFTDKGNTRKMYAANNSGLAERLLTPYDNTFEFELSDGFGYTVKQEVSADRFDLDGPEISYTIDNTSKTNQPVNISITIKDAKSGIAQVKFSAKGTDVPIVLTPEGDGSITGTAVISENGTYVITAYDWSGNKAVKSLAVANIDKEPPQITGLSYSTEAVTNQNVSVQIKGFTKSGVTITNTEPVDPLTTKDYQVSTANNLFNFSKNGAVSVFFEDECGNKGSDVITVSNIYDKPPSLAAVAELAADQLSVKVTFEREMKDGEPVDPFRKLEDLYVSCNGIVYRANAASFTLIENETYTFKVYDDAGMIQYIDLAVSGIDKAAPKITKVTWSYYYYKNENRDWVLKPASGSVLPGSEAGYTVADDLYPATNQDVTVTVTTDKETSYIGGAEDAVLSTAHELKYKENGLFNFNLKSANGLSDSYGVDIAIIDKKPPVIELTNASELMFIENSGTYKKELLLDYKAYDTFNGKTTDLTASVVVDWGGFDPDDLARNTFDRARPYYITYKVYDPVGNYCEIRRTVSLIGFYDTVALIDGAVPDATSSVVVNGRGFDVSLYNFSGTAYVKYAPGQYTMGQMKTRGTVVAENSGKYALRQLSKGWYTIYIQTDKRDYFNVYVYVSGN
ncbi:hypothetical protein [Lutispora saccharofermentans]|uniref:Ig-like domain-containing protein n=1 Tax=Lutispora saccharofermentans TaxID=3024236 RepID=A0ABT1ND65_9FIRM|nr:hypothetical protein [Lutispora saccharofermentans]MCQ1528574.1 hypothetical protein [Lutispora saccharofermentans]